MKAGVQASGPPDLAEYVKNCGQFPADELAKYAGRYVAFSLDGARILASADSEQELEDQLLASGIDPSQVVGSYVPPTGSSLLL
ncbi:MAG TPA: hypothetical protein VGY66_30930 [Gemmataceae bacterium]|jgi:hypothetical protein|nr:hypothetical protein [Gemmataceae bacterium]